MRALGSRCPDPATSAEDGFTLVELTLALAILMVVLMLVTPTFLVVSDGSNSVQAITTTDSALRPALQGLAAQVAASSGYVSPGAGAPNSAIDVTAKGSLLTLMYTARSGAVLCSQWEVKTAPNDPIDPANPREGVLQQRGWNPAHAPGTVPFVPTATGVVVVDPPSVQPFRVTGVGGGLLVVDLMVTSGPKTAVVQIDTSMAAQGMPALSDACSSTPATGGT